jgi:hypothetical protein
MSAQIIAEERVRDASLKLSALKSPKKTPIVGIDWPTDYRRSPKLKGQHSDGSDS